MKGVLPFGVYLAGGGITYIVFCCQASQDPNIPISLPIDKPFYLMAFKSSVCQKVKWTTVTPQFIVYDTSDYRNNNLFSNYTPFDGTKQNPKIYYCYYEGMLLHSYFVLSFLLRVGFLAG